MYDALRFLIGVLGAFVISSVAYAQAYDVVIKGGRVIDPASGRDEVADVGIRGHTIAAISRSPLSGKRVLDAKGLVVSPGFIDLHAHGQEPLARRLQMQDGVTTALEMEYGVFPIQEMLAGTEGHSVINFGATASYSCARTKVIANIPCRGLESGGGTHDQRIAALRAHTTPEQERSIVALMNAEIRSGALGYGVPVGYATGAGRREIFEIFKEAGRTQYPVFTHVRGTDEDDPAPGATAGSAQEVIADAAATGAPLQIVHVHSTGRASTTVILEMIAGARRRGIDITTEAYPYDAGSIPIGAEGFRPGWQKRTGLTYSDIQVPATGERLTEETFNRLRAENPETVVIAYGAVPRDQLDAAILSPIVSIATDGMPWATSGEHPRGSGTFSRVLGYYVRERGLDLKLALAKMTIMPARRLEAVSAQMARKGRLQEGADADITVFDPGVIKDMSTYEKPMQPSTGIRYVLVNGVPTLVDGKVVLDVFPGKAIRSSKPL